MTSRNDDYVQFSEALQSFDVPRLCALMANHIREKCSLSSLIPKVEKASEVYVNGSRNFSSHFMLNTNRLDG